MANAPIAAKFLHESADELVVEWTATDKNGRPLALFYQVEISKYTEQHNKTMAFRGKASIAIIGGLEEETDYRVDIYGYNSQGIRSVDACTLFTKTLAKSVCPKLTPENAQQHFVVPIATASEIKLGDMVVFTELLSNPRLKGGQKASVVAAKSEATVSRRPCRTDFFFPFLNADSPLRPDRKKSRFARLLGES